VEGQTEEKFIPIMFDNLFGSNLYSNLIKVINAKGINNVPGFASAILELIGKENIFTLVDNDADETTIELIDQLTLDDTNKFTVGTKEFEDSFEPKTIYESWKKYVESCGRQIGNLWHEDLIAQKRNECIREDKKFSKELRVLNSGSKKMDKITLGMALGQYCPEDELDENLKNLLYALNE
jgi:putative ATP-dependent endonuclease of OLD family